MKTVSEDYFIAQLSFMQTPVHINPEWRLYSRVALISRFNYYLWIFISVGLFFSSATSKYRPLKCKFMSRVYHNKSIIFLRKTFLTKNFFFQFVYANICFICKIYATYFFSTQNWNTFDNARTIKIPSFDFHFFHFKAGKTKKKLLTFLRNIFLRSRIRSTRKLKLVWIAPISLSNWDNIHYHHVAFYVKWWKCTMLRARKKCAPSLFSGGEKGEKQKTSRGREEKKIRFKFASSFLSLLFFCVLRQQELAHRRDDKYLCRRYPHIKII